MSEVKPEIKQCSRCHSICTLEHFEKNRKCEWFKLCNNCRARKIPDNDTKHAFKIIVDVLMRLDNEAKEYEAMHEEYIRRAQAIKNILDKVKEDFGSEAVGQLVTLTSEKLGHTLGPLHFTIVKELINIGFKVNNTSTIISFKTN